VWGIAPGVYEGAGSVDLGEKGIFAWHEPRITITSRTLGTSGRRPGESGRGSGLDTGDSVVIRRFRQGRCTPRPNHRDKS